MGLKLLAILISINISLFAAGEDLTKPKAKDERSRFSADKYIRKTAEHKVILDGNVKVIKGDSVLTADSVELDTETDEFTARGSVVFKGANFEMRGDEMKSNMGSAHGVLKKGYVTSKVDRVDGRDIERLSRKEFKIKEGRYTSCKNTPPDWRFYGNSINLTIGEYSHMNNVIVEGWGVPIAYIPYLVLPITERQTGSVPPHFSFGADGFGIHESLFVTMGRSQDATATLGHYNNRGFKQGLEYRYAASDKSSGSFYIFHIDDKKFSNLVLPDGQPMERRNRESIRMDNTTALGDVTFARTKLRYASDANLPRDFVEEIDGRADAALESRLVVTSKSNNAAYTGQSIFYQDLLSTNPLNSNKNQLHVFPQLTMNVAKMQYSGFMLEGDASYLHIYRASQFFDDNNNNGIYDPGDFIRTGHRLDFNPRISRPINTKFIKITPQAGFRYDFYQLPVDGPAQKGYAEIKTDVSTEITQIYQRDKGTHYRAVKHVIEPFVTHDVIPNVWKTHHPFFDTVSPANGTTSPMFDSIDSIGRGNTVTYGVTNRLLVKYIENPIPVIEKVENEEDIRNKDDGEYDALMAAKKALRKEMAGDNIDDLCTSNDELMEWIKKREAEQAKTAKEKQLFINNLMLPTTKDLSTTEKPAYLEDIKDVETFVVMQPVQWKVYQSYNFASSNGVRPFSFLYSDLSGAYSWASVILSNFYNVYTHKMGLNSFVTLASAGGTYLRVGYTYNKTDVNVAVNQARFGVGFKFWRFGTNFRFIFNNEVVGTLSQKIQDRYFDVSYFPKSGCWYLQIIASSPYDRPGFMFTFTFNLIISGESVGLNPAQGGAWNKM